MVVASEQRAASEYGQRRGRRISPSNSHVVAPATLLVGDRHPASYVVPPHTLQRFFFIATEPPVAGNEGASGRCTASPSVPCQQLLSAQSISPLHYDAEDGVRNVRYGGSTAVLGISGEDVSRLWQLLSIRVLTNKIPSSCIRSSHQVYVLGIPEALRKVPFIAYR